MSALLGPFAVRLTCNDGALPCGTLSCRTLSVPREAGRGSVESTSSAGFDGSGDSVVAAVLAIGLFGSSIRRGTLGAVLDIDAAVPHADGLLYPQPWPEERHAREQLDAAAATPRASSDHEPGQIVVAGQPADALDTSARNEVEEVFVVGCRGRRLSKVLLGSCAWRLAGTSAMSVLISPREPAAHGPGAPRDAVAAATFHGDGRIGANG